MKMSLMALYTLLGMHLLMKVTQGVAIGPVCANIMY